MTLLRKLFGPGMKDFYVNYYFNRTHRNYLKIGKHVMLQGEMYTAPTIMELDSYTRIQPNVRVIASEKQKVIIKKFSSLGAGCTIIPGNHIPTVGIPQYLSYLAINDINNTIVINEDVWVGANSTLLYKANIGRGAVIGANSLVAKEVPPYAVVAGSPAKIIAVRFSLEQILEHEKHLYPKNERLSKEYLQALFEKQYSGLKTIGMSYLAEDMKKQLEEEKKMLEIIDYFNE